MSEQNSQNKDKVRIDFPPKWVTTEKANGEPYTISNGKGDSWPAVKCTLPTGTKVDGKDLSGFNFTTFQKPWNKADIEAGKGTGVFVNADRNVSLFKYDKDGQRHDESVEPQKLSDAVEAAREEYRAQHQSHDRSQEQETGLDELCEQKTAEASERDGGSQDRSAQNGPLFGGCSTSKVRWDRSDSKRDGAAMAEDKPCISELFENDVLDMELVGKIAHNELDKQKGFPFSSVSANSICRGKQGSRNAIWE